MLKNLEKKIQYIHYFIIITVKNGKNRGRRPSVRLVVLQLWEGEGEGGVRGEEGGGVGGEEGGGVGGTWPPPRAWR